MVASPLVGLAIGGQRDRPPCLPAAGSCAAYPAMMLSAVRSASVVARISVAGRRFALPSDLDLADPLCSATYRSAPTLRHRRRSHRVPRRESASEPIDAFCPAPALTADPSVRESRQDRCRRSGQAECIVGGRHPPFSDAAEPDESR